jgi:integrase
LINSDFARLPFRQASQIWLRTKTHIVDRTRHDYDQYFTALNHYFGDLALDAITLDNLWDYQRKRTAGQVQGLKKAGNTRTNHEMGALTQVLDYADLWDKNKKWFKLLKVSVNGEIGIAITPQEEECLFRTASRSNRWLVAYCCSLISVNTTAGPGEIRNLRLRDVDLETQEIKVVEGAKNKSRVRNLPLNDHALWAVGILVARAKEKGATLPEHYLLPHRADSRDGSADPTKPMGSWKKAWGSLRAEAGRFYPRLAKLRMYDLRHQVITKLLENPSVPEGTVKALAGHVSERILNRYSHIRTQSKRDAVDALLKEPVAVAVPAEPRAVIRRSTPRPPGPKRQRSTKPLRPVLAFSRRNAG